MRRSSLFDVSLFMQRDIHLGPFHTVGLALGGELSVSRGNPAEGMALFAACPRSLTGGPNRTLLPAFHVPLAEGLMKAGEADVAGATADAGLDLVRRSAKP